MGTVSMSFFFPVCFVMVDIFLKSCLFQSLFDLFVSFLQPLFNRAEHYLFDHRADSAAVAITTTDLVSKSVAVETEVGKDCLF